MDAPTTTNSRRDTLPSVDDLALTYADGARVNPVSVALRFGRATEVHDRTQALIDDLWAMVDAARNRP